MSSYPGGRFGEVFLISMDPTFDTLGDVMPKSRNWPHHQRKKYVHSVGTHGKIKFVPQGDQPYTGIFKGADYGIVRLSLAIAPSATSKGSPFTPGMGLKFLRSGVDSANLVSMFSVEGTPDDWNFFSKAFRNH